MRHLILVSVILVGCVNNEDASNKNTSASHDGEATANPSCPFEDLSAAAPVSLEHKDQDAPVPRHGDLPSSGVFDLTSWIAYDNGSGLARDFSMTYRFRESQMVDVMTSGGGWTMKWSIINATQLALTVACPSEQAGQVLAAYEYTFDGSLYLFSDDGVMMLTPRP